ncbi:C-C motif chemokine 20b [Antennarius striatus]|uniref:C-C motif chemokine 20b n=1 Tax=Antennarius striatus TaxID=241820 RepID=UPI0035B227D4
MTTSVRLVGAACFLLILSSFIAGGRTASCCLKYVRRPFPCQRLQDYAIQTITNSCDINAVIFQVLGRFVCADPAASWTLRGVECLRNRRRKITQSKPQGYEKDGKISA